jgi:DNA-binding response OmpR family regulator
MAAETILIIDDNAEMLEVLDKYILSPGGYRIITAMDGPSGLEMAIKTDPDLVLLDVNLPGLNGYEVLRILKQSTCNAPVVIMTVDGTSQSTLDAFRLGAADILVKPFRLDEVRDVVARSLKNSGSKDAKNSLDKNLLSAEAARITAFTLAHYINNYLTSLMGCLSLLDESIKNEGGTEEQLEIVRNCYHHTQEIQTVVRVMKNTTSYKLVDYFNSASIIDIEEALQMELNQLNLKNDR